MAAYSRSTKAASLQEYDMKTLAVARLDIGGPLPRADGSRPRLEGATSLILDVYLC